MSGKKPSTAASNGANGGGHSLAALPLVRSEGQRMLLHVTGSLAAIASELGVKSAQSVLDWRTGKKHPNPQAQAAMEESFGIPRGAWKLRPNGETAGTGHGSSEAAPLTEAEPIAPSGPPPTTLEDCMALLTVIRRDRNQAGLMAAERVKLADTEARILALRHRLEREAELSEDRLVREHPAWQRLKRLVVRALAKHPAAAKDVIAAMRAAGDGGEEDRS